MEIICEEIDQRYKQPGIYVKTVNIVVSDDSGTKYEKQVSLDFRKDRPKIFEGNLKIQVDEFMKEIPVNDKIDISESLATISVEATAKHKEALKSISEVKLNGTN